MTNRWPGWPSERLPDCNFWAIRCASETLNPGTTPAPAVSRSLDHVAVSTRGQIGELDLSEAIVTSRLGPTGATTAREARSHVTCRRETDCRLTRRESRKRIHRPVTQRLNKALKTFESFRSWCLQIKLSEPLLRWRASNLTRAVFV